MNIISTVNKKSSQDEMRSFFSCYLIVQKELITFCSLTKFILIIPQATIAKSNLFRPIEILNGNFLFLLNFIPIYQENVPHFPPLVFNKDDKLQSDRALSQSN